MKIKIILLINYMNSWINHIKQFRQQNPHLSYKECLKQGKMTYKRGGSQFSGYVQRLEAEKKITKESFKKIKEPSKWLINKYGGIEPVIQQEAEPLPEPVAEPIIEPQYDDIDLNAIKNKPKKKKQNGIDDATADKIAIQSEKQKKKQSQLAKLKKLKKDLLEYESKKRQMKSDYTKELNQLKKLRQTKENKKLYTDRIQLDVADKKALKLQYEELFNYIKRNKLNPEDFNEIEDYMADHAENIRKS